MSSEYQPVLFCNTAWMNEYRGNPDVDVPYNGGKWPETHGFGSEIFNFQPHRKRVYGFVQSHRGRIAIENLGAVPGAEFVDGIRIYWTATPPGGGRCLVGWYDNARVFREASRRHPCSVGAWEACYNVIALKRDAQLLLPDDRALFQIPDCRRTNGGWGMGQSSIRYVNRSGLAFLRSLEKKLSVQSNGAATGSRRKSAKSGWQIDSAKRLEVEQAAMKAVWDAFKDKWTLKDRSHTFGIGYDILATRPGNGQELFLEVKGCSGSAIACELTPSEVACMNNIKSRARFRLCVVTDALDAKRRKLHVFSYHAGLKQWTASGGRVLHVEDLLGARCSA